MRLLGSDLILRMIMCKSCSIIALARDSECFHTSSIKCSACKKVGFKEIYADDLSILDEVKRIIIDINIDDIVKNVENRIIEHISKEIDKRLGWLSP